MPETRARATTVTSSSSSRIARRLAVRHGGRALEHAVGAGPHLGRGELHALLQRLRELQQQLVERDRTRHARAERLQRLVGRLALAVDAAVRELLEPALRAGTKQQRGDRRGDHREPEHASLGLGRARRRSRARRRGTPTPTMHDEAADLDRVHEQPVDAHRERLHRRQRDRDGTNSVAPIASGRRDARPVQRARAGAR